MKKLTSLFLVLTLVFSLSAALADPTSIDGLSERNIKINPAGLNPSAEEMIAQGISPTTGRNLMDIEWQNNFAGAAVDGNYQPIMVQISNASNGVGVSSSGKLYFTAPVNGTYADVVYEAPQKRSGSETRMTMIFSDTIPDYVGFVRSTRLTHCRLRQEWECAFCTSGYAKGSDVPAEWKKLGVPDPANAKDDKPGIVYVGDYPKVWRPYVWRLSGIKSANSELFMAADIVRDIVPKDHVPANHTWLFTDEIPEGGDPASIVYVTFGNWEQSDSRLEYDESVNGYTRWVQVTKTEDAQYKDVTLVDPQVKQVLDSDGNKVKKVVAERPVNETFVFNNVIVQSVSIKWPGGLRPDPQLVGKGNADYFMCGQHYEGVWERTDINSRTVFYGKDGNEIELQRGKTLIILMDYTEKHSGGKGTVSVKYE